MKVEGRAEFTEHRLRINSDYTHLRPNWRFRSPGSRPETSLESAKPACTKTSGSSGFAPLNFRGPVGSVSITMLL